MPRDAQPSSQLINTLNRLENFRPLLFCFDAFAAGHNAKHLGAGPAGLLCLFNNSFAFFKG